MMTSPQDALYQETKRIRLQGLPIGWPFAELSAWASLQYRLRVFNAALEFMPHNPSVARLIVVLDTEDELSFLTRNDGYLTQVQERFAVYLQDLLTARGDPRLDGKRLLVIFTSLERIARIEANERVTQRDVDRLQAKLHNPALWHISRNYDSVTFFFHTEAQVVAAQNSGLLDLYAQAYAHVVAPYDELSYLRKRGINVYFESKENFEKNYQGSWLHYYK